MNTEGLSSYYELMASEIVATLNNFCSGYILISVLSSMYFSILSFVSWRLKTVPFFNLEIPEFKAPSFLFHPIRQTGQLFSGFISFLKYQIQQIQEIHFSNIPFKYISSRSHKFIGKLSASQVMVTAANLHFYTDYHFSVSFNTFSPFTALSWRNCHWFFFSYNITLLLISFYISLLSAQKATPMLQQLTTNTVLAYVAC